MKFTPFVSAILLSLQFSNSLAAGYLCQPITGELQTPLQPQPYDTCMVYNAKKDYFPDLDFKTPQQFFGLPVCYSAVFDNGTLGSGNQTINITGTVDSALTNSVFDSLALTAASIITINAIDGKLKKLGIIYTQDSIIDPFDPLGLTTRERLAVVRSNPGNIKGHIDIIGNATFEAVAFTGKLCILKK